MPCSIELLSTRENKARKSRICLRGEKRKKKFARMYKEIYYFLKISSRNWNSAPVFFHGISFFTLPLLPLFYYSLFYESLHKKMHLAQNVDSTFAKHRWKFSGYTHRRFPFPQVFGHCPKGFGRRHIELIRRLPRNRKVYLPRYLVVTWPVPSFALNTGILLTKSRPTFKYPKLPR